MSDAWFHAPELTGDSRTLKLSEQEARHAVRVRRLDTGHRIVVFNGRGVWAQAELKNKSGDLEILGTHEAPAQNPRIHLAAALPKGERFGVLLSMATQLGIATFTPLSCEHGVVQPGERHAVRGQRILVEACKQSRNAWLPDWRDPATPAELKSVTLYAHPGGASLATLMDGHVVDRADDHVDDHTDEAAIELTVLVGPEGGFSVAETTELEAQGAAAVSLGPNILRIETAAVALIAGLRLMSGGAVNSSAESLS